MIVKVPPAFQDHDYGINIKIFRILHQIQIRFLSNQGTHLLHLLMVPTHALNMKYLREKTLPVN